MKVAIVGCGQISRMHVTALRQIDGIQICAVCDRDMWRAQDIASLAGGANIYTDFRSLLEEERPTAVHVLTPPDSHAELAILAMEAGCHVLVEKPMATSLEDADRMVAVAEAKQVKLCTNHSYLFKHSIVKARQLVEDGVIGRVIHVNSWYGVPRSGNYSGSRGQSHWAWRLRGGVLTNFLPHLVYLHLAFLRQVDAVPGLAFSQPDGHGKPETDMTVLLQGPTASGVMTFSLSSQPFGRFVTIYGTKGVIHADLIKDYCTVHTETRLPYTLSAGLTDLADSARIASGAVTHSLNAFLGKTQDMPQLVRFINEFYASLRGDRPVPVTAEEGKQSVKVMEMIWAKAPLQTAPRPEDLPVTASKAPRTAAERLVAEKGMPGKVLVTGATGLLGQSLVAALSRCGADVVALVRDRSRVAEELGQQATIVQGDIRDPASLAAAMQDIAVVYHCAALTNSYAPWKDHYEVNVRGTEHVLQAAANAGVQRFIHVSSIIVYGVEPPPDRQSVSESAPYASGPHKWAHYMRSKIEADRLAMSYWHNHRLPVTVVRPGLLYEMGSVDVGRMQLIIGQGNNLVAYTFVNNAVDCLLLAAVCPEAVGEIYNVVDEPQLTLRELYAQIQKVTGQATRLVPIPVALLQGLTTLAEIKSNLTGSKVPPKLTRFSVRSAIRNMSYDCSKARQQLGWQPAFTLSDLLQKAYARE